MQNALKWTFISGILRTGYAQVFFLCEIHIMDKKQNALSSSLFYNYSRNHKIENAQ